MEIKNITYLDVKKVNNVSRKGDKQLLVYLDDNCQLTYEGDKKDIDETYNEIVKLKKEEESLNSFLKFSRVYFNFSIPLILAIILL